MINSLKNIYKRAVITDHPVMLLISNIRAPKRYYRRLVYDQVLGKIPFFSKSTPARATEGKIDTKTVDAAVAALRSKGIVAFEGYFADLARQLRERYARPEDEYKAADRYDRTYFGPTGSDLIIDVSLNETLLTIAAKYMGCQPYLRIGSSLAVLKPASDTVPRYGVPSGLQEWPWHIDTPNLLSFHILLNDVPPSATRMRYAMGSHKINRAASGARSEELITGRHDIFECCGPAGTVYIFDNNGFHRPHAVANSTRITFEFYFTPGNQIYSMQQTRRIVEEDGARGKRDLQHYGDGVFDDVQVPARLSPIQREALAMIIEKTNQQSAT